MNRLFLILFFVLISTLKVVYAQNKFSDEQYDLWDSANDLYEITDYYGAYEKYLELSKADSDYPELNYKLGVCLFMLQGDTYEALNYLEQASYGNFTESYYYIGRCYHLLGKFGMATKYYNYYKENDNGNTVALEEVDRHIDIALRAKEMLKQKSGIEIINLGENINTKYSDYVPLVSGNDSMMIFTSRREGSTGGKKDPFDNYFEDIYVSFKNDDQWAMAKNMGSKLNTETHDACVGLSRDGKTLIIFRTNASLTGGDLYMSTFDNNDWSIPEKLSENINSDYQEASATLSSDGNLMYFSSNRPGGYGGKDIYRCVRFGNGDWSLPLNLGPVINTAHDDDAPFLLADDETMYFSSKGHQTIGGYDVFKTKLEEGSWKQPTTMGYPINTVDDDIYFSVTSDEEVAYYSSGKSGGEGGQDIYQINMFDRSLFVTIVKGYIKGSNNEPLKGKITVIDEATNKVQGIYRSNDKTGKYLMILSPKKTYKLIVDVKKHETLNDNITLNFDENFVEVSKDFIVGKE